MKLRRRAPSALIAEVGCQQVHAPNQVNVDVIQAYVNGEKPSGLPGARDDAITLEAGERIR